MRMAPLLIGGAVLAVGLGVYAVSNQSQKAEPGSGAPIVDVVVPELTAAEKQGEAAFNQYCAQCHGKNAAGQEGVAPPFVHPIYRPGHHADAAFQFAAANGVRAHHWPFGNMPPVAGVSVQDVDSIVNYVRALQRANGIE